MEHRTGGPRPRLWGAIALGALALILAVTLYPNPQGAVAAQRTPLLCLVCGEHGGTDVFLNLLLFIPFAVALRLSGVRRGPAIAACAAISLLVESLQFAVITGRDASLSDLVTNTIGGAIGATIARPVLTALLPDRGTATRLTLVTALSWLLMLAICAWLMGPWTPTDSRASSHWPPDSAWPGSFAGKVIGVESAGIPLPSGELPDSAGRLILPRLQHGRIELRVDLISAREPSNHRRWIYFLQVGRQFAPRLSREGGDLLLELPVRAAHFRLSAPTLLLRNGMPRRSGVPVTITVSEVRGYTSLVSSYGGRTFTLNVDPTQGWSLIDPFAFHLGPDVRLLTGLWLAGWLLPLGYWSARSGRSGAAFVLAIVTVALGLGLLPSLAGFPPVHRSEWLAAGVGLAIGRALGASAAYLASRCGSPSASESSSS